MHRFSFAGLPGASALPPPTGAGQPHVHSLASLSSPPGLQGAAAAAEALEARAAVAAAERRAAEAEKVAARWHQKMLRQQVGASLLAAPWIAMGAGGTADGVAGQA